MLSRRVLSAMVLIPLVIAAIYFGGLFLAGLGAIAAILATIEFYQISMRLGARPSIAIGAALAGGLVLVALFPGLAIGPAAFIIVLGALMLARVIRQDYNGFLLDWASTLVGSAYIGGMLSHLVLLRNLPQGLAWTALAIVTTWVADTAAYFAGTAWGRRPFFPRVSPRKTLEGAIAALVAGPLLAVGIAVPFLRVPWPQAVGLGLTITLASIFGDLAESLIKRQAGVKDSGNLIPGHGGALDRIDSILFTGVAVYYYVIWIIRVPMT